MGKAARTVPRIFFVRDAGTVSKKDSAGESGFLAREKRAHFFSKPPPDFRYERPAARDNFRLLRAKLWKWRFSSRGDVFLPFGYFDSFARRKTVQRRVKTRDERLVQRRSAHGGDFHVESRRTDRRHVSQERGRGIGGDFVEPRTGKRGGFFRYDCRYEKCRASD